MSEERGKEKKVEIDHFYHHHPLILSEVGGRFGECFGCTRYIHPVDTAYVCRDGCGYPILHEECAEMPREIKLSMHPQHTLIQKEVTLFSDECAICEQEIYWISYCCASADGCGFHVHVGCANNIEILPSSISHPSHPQHQLTSLWRPGRSFSSRCDACGTIEKGNSYMCMICQYLIHDSCANLSPTAQYDHHDHPLSLVYHLPLEYIKFNFTCDICLKRLLPRYWIYRCETCRYVAHIKCAIRNSRATTISIDEAKDAGVAVFPINNVVEELIGAFVGEVMPNPSDQIVNGKYKFHTHDHPLNLVSSSPYHQENEQEDEEEDDDDEVQEDSDEDDFHYGAKSQLVCDGCTMPLFPKTQKSSLKYLSCGECKYFLHWTCFHLPPQITSHPLHPHPHHNLTLQTRPKLDFVKCDVCYICTNGLFYGCTECDFKVDVKCASLPNTIKHKSHLRRPNHHLKLLNSESTGNSNYWGRVCGACGYFIYKCASYQCDICEIILHCRCVLLPAVIANRNWDKHQLQLTFDPSKIHSSSFDCDICEEQMNPKHWMYHCRTCNLSAHPRCFPTASGVYRNIKFGQRYDVAPVHHHPVAYQLLTKKLNCDVCGERKEYGCPGFQCASDKCEFFMCYICAADRLPDQMKADYWKDLLYFSKQFKLPVARLIDYL